MKLTSYLLCIDFGDKRIGVAVASQHTLIPKPYKTINNNEKSIDIISQIIQQQNVDMLVVGLPRNLNGEDTAQTRKVREFVGELKSEIKCKIVFQDEAFSSMLAEEELASHRRAFSKGEIDALAATYILKDYINDNMGNHE